MAEGPQIGDIVTATFPVRDPQGHEQEGRRPAVVVGLPSVLGPGRFEMLVVVPFTSYRDQPWVHDAPDRYPHFPAGAGGLRSPSVALLDQIAAIDAGRVSGRRGRFSVDEYRQVRQGLERLLRTT